MTNFWNDYFEKTGAEIYELIPTDGRKSFYGKAKVIRYPNGDELLLSYDTAIAIKENGKVHRLWDGWSATTGRHIKAFCGMNKAEFTKLAIEK